MSKCIWMPSREIPDFEVNRYAEDYLKAASLCERNSLEWVAGINAAFAIELFLKAYVIEVEFEEVEQFDANGFPVEILRKNTGRKRSRKPHKKGNGHGLVDIYQSIPEEIRIEIKNRSNQLCPHFEELLEKLDGVFEKARYAYERNDPLKTWMHLSDLLELARFLSDTAIEVSRNNLGKK